MTALAALEYSPADHAICEVCQTGVCWCPETCDGFAPGTCTHGVSACVDCSGTACVSCRLPIKSMSLITSFQIPIDPEDLDATRPEDIDACTWCLGLGVLTVPGPDERDRVCGQCHGTGKRGAR